jgi:CHAT domain-containing protein
MARPGINGVNEGSTMNRTGKTLIMACVVAAVLAASSPARAQTSALQAQISQHEQKLADARAGHKTKDVMTELAFLGTLYRMSGKMQKALDCLNEALPIAQKADNHVAQAMILNALGRIYTDLGQEDKALTLFDQSLPIYRSLELQQGEAITLNDMGKVYNNLGKRDEALKHLNEAMAIWHEIDSQGAKHMTLRQKLHNLGQLKALKEMNEALPNWRETIGRAGEASTLDNLGRTYSDMAQGRKALESFNQALTLWREAGVREGEALTLNNMGSVNADLGLKQKSLEDYSRALAIWHESGSREGEALTLNSLGRLYRDLGQHQTALDYYNQALPIWREVGMRNGEALVLSDIGRAYADLGQPRKALEYCDQALPIFRETGSRRGQAMTLNNMGRDHSLLEEADKALDLDIQALTIWREVKDQRGEALALMTIGWAFEALKEPEKALACTLSALSLAKAASDPEIEGGIETSLMVGFRKENHRDEAIFFGMEAVNSYQRIRRNISRLEKALQTGFAQSKSGTYRALAELLIEAGRLGEAEQVLDLLKEQELKDIVRGVDPDAAAKVEPLKFTAAQLRAESELPALENMARAIVELSIEYAVLQAKAARTSEEDARLGQMKAGIEHKREEILAFMTNTVFPTSEQDRGPDQGNGLAAGENSPPSYLQNALAKLGPRVKGIRLLLGENHVYAIVITASTRKKVELKVTPSELRRKAFETLKALAARSSDPRPQLAQLYGMVVAPLEDELKTMETPSDAQGRAPTLLWSLDDALRYVPMAALYDGQRYMVERFNNVLFTPESYGHMTDAPLLSEAKSNVLAMGLSKSYGGLPPLPGVVPELNAVVHDPAVSDSHGPMEGKLLPNEQFTLAALKAELGTGKSVPVVHIASHFVVETGSGEEPYLMLGGGDSGDTNGYAWNLSDMENSPVAFHGTRLLTLSACSTAKDYKSRDGVEMDSLGMIAQQKDAEAVMATLWDVNDASTSQIMSDFYARWVKAPAEGKAEALRQAQLAFLRGPVVSPNKGNGRGVKVAEGLTSSPSSASYSHPYYWAPFVLIGNYK